MMLGSSYRGTVKGEMPEIKIGKHYFASGTIVNDAKWGPSIKIFTMDINHSLETEEEKRMFFSYFLGASTVDLLFETYEDPIAILDAEDKKSLMKIKGIGEVTAEKIIQKYKDNLQHKKGYAELGKYGLTSGAIEKLRETYGSYDMVIQRLEENPYILADDIAGWGWKKTDKLARIKGIGINDIRRVKAYIRYYLNSLAEKEGDIWIRLEELREEVNVECIDCPMETFVNAVKEMIDSNLLFYDKPTHRIGMAYFRRVEEKIAKEILRLQKAEVVHYKHINETIRECEEIVGFKYSEEQVAAIKNLLENNISILTARGGAGKTSIMFPVSQIIRKNNKTVGLCALSGKASLNLSEMTQTDGRTIHRLLGYNPMNKTHSGFSYNSENKLGYDVIILDEVSMVGGQLYYDLISAIKDGAKFIMVGDVGQLESIGFSNCAKDIIDSKTVAHSHLTKIFRQALRSGIISESSLVYEGQYINRQNAIIDEVRGELRDFEIKTVHSDQDCMDSIVSKYKSWLNKGIPVSDIIVVCAKRTIGALSAKNINQKIQDLLTFNSGPTYERKYIDGMTEYKILYHVGDRVMVTHNMYDTKLLDGTPEPIFNGNTGTIKEIDLKKSRMLIEFSHGTVYIPFSSVEDMQLGYAASCHKCQGSGVPYVIYVCDPTAYTLLSKEHLYTGITRAKTFCFCIGTPYSFRKSVETSRVREKRTWLKELLVEQRKAWLKEVPTEQRKQNEVS